MLYLGQQLPQLPPRLEPGFIDRPKSLGVAAITSVGHRLFNGVGPRHEDRRLGAIGLRGDLPPQLGNVTLEVPGLILLDDVVHALTLSSPPAAATPSCFTVCAASCASICDFLDGLGAHSAPVSLR